MGYEYLDKYDEAINYYSKAISLKPRDDDLYFRRGWSYSRLKYSEAL